MNKIFAFAAAAVLSSSARAADSPKTVAEAMAPLKGLYHGYCPVDHSEVSIGEAEAIVDDKGFTLRAANGESIDEERNAFADFRLLSEEALAQRVGDAGLAAKLIAFEAIDGGGFPLILLGKDPSDMEGAMNLFPSRLSVMFGSQCQLFTPAQLRQGMYEKTILGPVEKAEEEAGRKLYPRLQFNGTPGPKTTKS